jgi:hypothetical protein
VPLHVTFTIPVREVGGASGVDRGIKVLDVCAVPLVTANGTLVEVVVRPRCMKGSSP